MTIRPLTFRVCTPENTAFLWLKRREAQQPFMRTVIGRPERARQCYFAAVLVFSVRFAARSRPPLTLHRRVRFGFSALRSLIETLRGVQGGGFLPLFAAGGGENKLLLRRIFYKRLSGLEGRRRSRRVPLRGGN